MPAPKCLHCEVYPDGDGATYHELLSIEGKTARVQISRTRRMRRAIIEVFADNTWRPVTHLAPAAPDVKLFAAAFHPPDTFKADRDELVRRFNLIYSGDKVGGGSQH